MPRGAKPFFVGLLVFSALAITALGGWGRNAFQLWANTFHLPILDQIFARLTHLGDGLVFAVLLVGTLFWRFRWALGAAITGLVTLMFVHVFKEILFHEAPRPGSVFSGMDGLHYVPGIDIHLINTFPSGHTTAAFAAYGFLALAINKPRVSWVMILLAVGVGYSRIYLMQHFLTDVLAGAWMGTLAAVLGYTIARRLGHGAWDKSLNPRTWKS